MKKTSKVLKLIVVNDLFKKRFTLGNVYTYTKTSNKSLKFLLFLFIQSSVQLLLKVIGIDLLYYKKNNLFRSSE